MNCLNSKSNQATKQLFLTAAIFLGALLATGHAQVQFTDDFESYSDQGAFNAAWGTATTAMTFTSTNRSTPSGAKSILQTGTQSSYKAFTNSVFSSNLYYRAYFYDAGASRSTCRVEGYTGGVYGTAVTQLLAIGRYNSITGSKYYGRQAYGGTTTGEGATAMTSTWFQLGGAANTSAGWHKAEIVGGLDPTGTSTIRWRFYIDGVLGGCSYQLSDREFNFVVLGSGLSMTGTGQWFDAVVVEGLQMVPQIATQPAPQTVNELQPVSFTIVATNSAATNTYALNTMKYQWQFNDQDIVGATLTSYSLAAASLTNTGNFRCIVSDAYGSQRTASDEAYLQVNSIPAPVIDAAPASQIVNLGSNATFSVTAHGGGTLYYTWCFFGTNISFTGTDNTYTLAGVTVGNGGPYSVIVTNDLGSPAATSAVATLTVNLPPSLTSATNQNLVVGTKAAIRMRATDDLSSESTLFQTFDSYASGTHVMFDQPSFSGSTGANVDTSQSNFSVVTNVYPDGHGSPRVLTARWTWTNNPTGSLRFTTSSSGGGVGIGGSPIISYTNRLRFDIFSDKDLLVGLGVRDSNPTGTIGASDTGTTGNLEWIGVSGSTPSRTVTANAWTTLDFDPVTDPIQGAYGVGNGVLDTTTGKGQLEHLYLMPGDGQPNPYTIYLDNFVVVANNAITFALSSGPVDAAIDPFTGIITWAPTTLGPTNFTVVATDFYGLTDTRTFTVTVVNPAATIVLTSPANNQSFTAPATVPVAANVTSNSNTIDYVGFYNGTVWTYVTNPPYSTSLSGVSAGSYSISATAFYGGSTASSATNHITVTSPLPPGMAITFVSDNVVISGAGTGSQTYVLYKTTDLSVSPIVWMPVQTNGPGSSYTFTMPVSTDAAAYFRVGAH